MYKISLSLLITLIVVSCSTKKTETVQQTNIVGLASPIKLQPNKTIVFLADYFNYPEKIDSISVNESISFILSKDNNTLILSKSNDSLPKLSSLKVWISKVAYSVLVVNSNKIQPGIDCPK